MFEDISKVIFITDMDGTFLPSNKIVTKKNLEAVRCFQEFGGKFSIATGRTLFATQNYLDTVKPDFPVILCNGANIYDYENKEYLYNKFLCDEAKDYVQQMLDNFPTLCCEIVTLDDVYVPKYTQIELEHISITKIQPKLVKSIKDIKGKWCKVLFCDEPENIDKLIDYINAKKYDGVEFVRSATTYHEMLPKDISKGNAIKTLREICDISQYTVVCAGDFYNDVEMLRNADFAFCPSNAADEVKSVCDVVLKNSCEQDAIACAIEFIIEKSKKSLEV